MEEEVIEVPQPGSVFKLRFNKTLPYQLKIQPINRFEPKSQFKLCVQSFTLFDRHENILTRKGNYLVTLTTKKDKDYFEKISVFDLRTLRIQDFSIEELTFHSVDVNWNYNRTRLEMVFNNFNSTQKF